MSASAAAAAASEKSAKRKAAIAAKREAEKKASLALGKDVKIVLAPKKKIKSKKPKNGDKVHKKWILKYDLKVNIKTGEATLKRKEKSSAAKSKVQSAEASK